MTLVFDARQEKTIHAVFEWFQFLADLLGREKARVLSAMTIPGSPLLSPFVGLTRQEVEDVFQSHRDELDYVAMLDLMAAAEATVRLDYFDRVVSRSKAPPLVSKRFSKIDRSLRRNERPDLEGDILDTWQDLVSGTKVPVRDFKGALTLRHWLAHGRYWHPKIGRRQDSPNDIYDVSNNLLQAIGAWSTSCPPATAKPGIAIRGRLT
ncbi:MAG: hypothetical protein NT031_07105 [Planctomycetota bacterium]|nr:hypothetical protein [Planctomycetota bacterium]